MISVTDAMSIAVERVAQESEQRTRSLDLSDLGLESLPETLFGLLHLRRLELGTSDPRDEHSGPNRIDAQA